jgi:hypothetical protein
MNPINSGEAAATTGSGSKATVNFADDLYAIGVRFLASSKWAERAIESIGNHLAGISGLTLSEIYEILEGEIETGDFDFMPGSLHLNWHAVPGPTSSDAVKRVLDLVTAALGEDYAEAKAFELQVTPAIAGNALGPMSKIWPTSS